MARNFCNLKEVEIGSQLINFLTSGAVIIKKGFILDSNLCPHLSGTLQVIQPGSSGSFICLLPRVHLFIGLAHSCLEPPLHLYNRIPFSSVPPSIQSSLCSPSDSVVSCMLSSVSFSLPSLMRREITGSSGPSFPSPVTAV